MFFCLVNMDEVPPRGTCNMMIIGYDKLATARPGKDL